MKLLWISGFGLVGIFSRFGISRLAAPVSQGFPFGTFIINLMGSFLAGLLFGLFEQKLSGISSDIKLALFVGFLGGFTTFSAYSLETFQLIQTQKWSAAIIYCLGSSLLGLLFCAMGYKLS